MAFATAEPGQRPGCESRCPGCGTPSTGEPVLVPEGAGARLGRVMDGAVDCTPMLRWMMLSADRMVGKDFEGGLANLKELAQKP